MFLLNVRFFVIIFMFIQTGICLECHSCTSLESEDCGSNFNPSKTNIETCDVFETLCVKATMNLLKVNIVTRGCTVDNACRNWDDCTICDRSLCNSSSTVGPSFLVSITLLVIVRNFL